MTKRPKQDTKELKDKTDTHTNQLWSAVARGVGMVPPQGQVVIIQAKTEVKPAGNSTKFSALKPDRTTQTDRQAQLSRPRRSFRRSVSFASQDCQPSSGEHQGLVFHVDNGDVSQDDALQSLSAIAQVGSYCTQAAFLNFKTVPKLGFQLLLVYL